MCTVNTFRHWAWGGWKRVEVLDSISNWWGCYYFSSLCHPTCPICRGILGGLRGWPYKEEHTKLTVPYDGPELRGEPPRTEGGVGTRTGCLAGRFLTATLESKAFRFLLLAVAFGRSGLWSRSLACWHSRMHTTGRHYLCRKRKTLEFFQQMSYHG